MIALSDQQALRKTVRYILILILIILWSSAASIITNLLIIPILHHRATFSIYTWTFYIFLAFFSLLITVLPVWRFSTWLNAVTYGEAREKDLARLHAWTTASQSFYVLFIILFDLSFSGIVINEVSKPESFPLFYIQQAYFIFQFLFFQCVKEWMVKTQQLQTQTTNRVTELHPLYLKIWPFARILQILAFLTPAALFTSDPPNSSLSLIFSSISSLTGIYALELALRLARMMEQDRPTLPRLAHS